MPFSGIVSKQASLHRTVSGSLGPMTGKVNKKIWLSVSGSLGLLTGTVSYSLGVIHQAIGGILGGLTGTVTRRYLGKRTVSGNLSASGAVTKKAMLKKSVSGVLSFTGASMDNLLELFYITVSGTLGLLTGTISNRLIKAGTSLLRGIVRVGLNLIPK